MARRKRQRTGTLVLVASPDANARRRWVKALSADYVVRQTETKDDPLTVVRAVLPSVALVDLAYRDGSTPSWSGLIQNIQATTKVIALAKEGSPREAAELLQEGVRGYCSRTIDDRLLPKAVEMVQKGELWVTREVIPYLLEQSNSSDRDDGVEAAEPGNVLDGLSSREREIARLVHAGESNKRIAETLGITETTVKAHLTVIYRKLGIQTRVQLALLLTGKV